MTDLIAFLALQSGDRAKTGSAVAVMATAVPPGCSDVKKASIEQTGSKKNDDAGVTPLHRHFLIFACFSLQLPVRHT
ncbi:hypothetical protein [Cohnella laeviribosi]|uniref:hypothetical protein n=1 Tax=Cohnella laeviribosi TaxID=380174 RepID=UPI0012EB2029|nr:hypothetical protein [Cohnella laeviribosi]